MAGVTRFHTDTVIGGQPLIIDLSQPLSLLEKPTMNYPWMASALRSEARITREVSD